MSKLATNISHLRGLKKLSQEQLADGLGISRPRLGAYEEGRNEPPIEILIRLSEYFHIAIDALIKGDLRKTDPDSLMKIGKNRLLFPILIDKDNNDVIEVVPVKAKAGYLNGYTDPEYIGKLQVMSLPFQAKGKHRAFPIKGDSMLPVKDGAFVVGKFLESIQEVKDGMTYVVLTKDDGIVYKRVYNHLKKEGALALHSDNKEYEPYKVKAEEILELWEFVCCINNSDEKEEYATMEAVMSMLNNLNKEVQRIRKN